MRTTLGRTHGFVSQFYESLPPTRPHRRYRCRGTCSLSTTPRVHVLGLGSIGTFTAHALADMAPRKPEPTLMLHRQSLLDDYAHSGHRITLETNGGRHVEHSGYHIEVLRGQRWHHVEPNTNVDAPPSHRDSNANIDHLILCVKSTQTVDALRPLLHRLNQDSSIIFLQNGAGMVEDVNEALWTDPRTRPTYITGVISHGVTLKAPFSVKHTGPAATFIGPNPRNDSTACPISPSAVYLLGALPQSPRLRCQSYQWPDILQKQLEKIAVNAFSNPLTALADSTVEYLFTIPHVCRALMKEISSVITALPELQEAPDVAQRFSAANLEATVMNVIVQNRKTTCSMVFDMRAGRETEIRYINGYWARRGREVGVPTPVNDEIISRIHEKTLLRRRKDIEPS